jgi:hypothetical protein
MQEKKQTKRGVIHSRKFLNLFHLVITDYFQENFWDITKKIVEYPDKDKRLIPVLIFPLGKRTMVMLPIHVVELSKDRKVNNKLAYIASLDEIKKIRHKVIKNAKSILL